MPRLYYDPPELLQYQDRQSVSIYEMQVGVPHDIQDVMAACGDPRDWFRFHWRREAWLRHWLMFFDAYDRRRNILADFTFGHTLILGPYGAGKTTLGLDVSLPDFDMGHPLFSNAAYLIGWELPYEKLYTAIGVLPKASILMIDEASASFNSRLSVGVGISTMAESILNTRKQLVRTYQMTAQDRMVAPVIRYEVDNVWMPVPKDKLKVEGERRGITPRNPARDPDNFQIAWFVWVDKPYDKGSIILNEDKTADGFGPPDFIYFDHGDMPRDAYLLTDTFQPAQVGVARTLDNEEIKDDIRVGLGKGTAETTSLALIAEYIENLYEMTDPPKWVRPVAIAEASGVTALGTAKTIRQQYAEVTYVKSQGFLVAELIAAEARRRTGGTGPLSDYMEPQRSVEDVLMEKINAADPHNRPGTIFAKDIAEDTGMAAQQVGEYIYARWGIRTKQKVGYYLNELARAMRGGRP